MGDSLVSIREAMSVDSSPPCRMMIWLMLIVLFIWYWLAEAGENNETLAVFQQQIQEKATTLSREHRQTKSKFIQSTSSEAVAEARGSTCYNTF
mmetsp:Transcript_24279/g.43502  ORF Transcript_24279/g.43502 Transcript_24279/m.43502 type:complete len:94 (-) Transcript_24279:7-288(-)